MKTLKALTVVLISAVISVPAMANTWEALETPQGGISYIASERFKNTGLGLFVETKSNCRVRLVVIDEFTKEKSKDLYIGKQFGKMRIDGGKIWTNDEVVTYRSNDEASGDLFNSITTLDDGDELLKELQSGNSLIVKIANQESDKFSLSGFTRSYHEAISHCGKALLEKDEWGDVSPVKGEWDV